MCTAVKKWPAPSWLFSSVGRALHRYRRGHGFKSLRAWIFFRSHFSTTGSVVFIAARIAYISFLHRRLYSANLLLSKIQAYKRNLLSSIITNRVRLGVIVCVWSKLVLQFTRIRPFYQLLSSASAERRTFYSCQFHLSLKCLLTRCLVSYQIHHI